MDKLNMLSAKKVKLHGMTSARWTTKDKITQYKGLINLYTRDRNIIEVDTAVANKKQYRDLLSLQKTIINDRAQLENAIRGNKQQLRNTLAEHKDLQLAYQNCQPKKVIDDVEHVNFKKRKELDRLKFTMKMRSQCLIDLKLEKSVLEDRIKYDLHEKTPIEKQAQIIAGKVQDAILKKEAALAIKQAYAQMIQIMKRDALYFDAISNTIQNDGQAQNKCMINAMKLGQLATEYLDDRRTEYKNLERIVIKDMQARKKDLSTVQDEVEHASDNVKHLIRRDSDVNTCVVKVPDSESLLELQTDFRKIDKTLAFLKSSTLVSNYEMIFPCFKEQASQRKRLTDLTNRSEQHRDNMLNKNNHAELMRNILSNTMVETTLDYKDTKQQIQNQIANEIERKRKLNIIIKERVTLTAKVRISLSQLQQICKSIKKKGAPTEEHNEMMLFKQRLILQNALPPKPDEDEIDGCKVIQELLPQLAHLSSVMDEYIEEGPRLHEAFKYYEALMKERSCIKQQDKGLPEDNLLEGLMLEVSHILTRDDIKKQSDEIVAANSKNDDLVPMFVVEKKKFK